MIHGNMTVTVTKGVSTINDKIILYRGDRKVEVIFEILQSAFKFSKGENLIMTAKASYGQLIIDKPDETFIFSDLSKCEDGKVKFTITGDMIDELTEVGLYSLQIRLYDETRASRITIPPVMDAIEIREPMAEEIGDDIVGDAIVGGTTVEDEGIAEETFDENGTYNQTTWYTGDKITESKLNKIEDAIYTVNEKVKDVEAPDISGFITESELEAKGYLTEHQSLEGYATETYVDEAVANAEVEVDLTGYATEEFVNDAVSKIGSVDTEDLVISDTISLGTDSTASGQCSYAGGYKVRATGKWSHAEGGATTASGMCSHAEGQGTIAASANQHAQGRYNKEDSANTYAHIVGNGTVMSKSNAHTLDWKGNAWFAGKVTADGTPENDNDLTTKKYVDEAVANAGGSGEVDLSDYAPIDSPNFINAISMGRKADTTVGTNSVALGDEVTASGENSHAEGYCTIAASFDQHAQGRYNIEDAANTYAHIVGNGNDESDRSNAHTLDWNGNAWFAGDVLIGGTSQNEGASKLATETYVDEAVANAGGGSGEVNLSDYAPIDSPNFTTAVSMGRKADTIVGTNSVALGENLIASGIFSHAEGVNNTASGKYSHAEGNYNTASGECSHAEGANNTASGLASHAEGNNNKASGDASHAEGGNNTASGITSHAEGSNTTASGDYGAHAEGCHTTASGRYSHAEGNYTIASSDSQHVQGTCNVEDKENKYAHIVGNGDSPALGDRSNAHTLDWDGNAWFAGKVTAEGTPENDNDLVTKAYMEAYIDEKLREIETLLGGI